MEQAVESTTVDRPFALLALTALTQLTSTRLQHLLVLDQMLKSAQPAALRVRKGALLSPHPRTAVAL